MTKSIHKVVCFAVFCSMTIAATRTWAQEQQVQQEQPKIKIDWQQGPTVGKLGSIAEIQIPKGYKFAGKDGAAKLLELTHNLVSGDELGVIVAEDSDWFMIFEFDKSGYVKDDEGDKLDSEAILKSITKNTDEANAERAKRGWKPIHVTGWKTPPYYDAKTHNLTWASLVRGEDTKDEGAVNHSVRILGRRGTMNIDLVASPDEYAASTGQFGSLMSGFHYTASNRYSDFVQGDKMAEYGLTALIVGGGAAVALKTGLLAKLWKFIVIGIMAIAGAIKKLFQSIFGKEEKIEDPNQQAMSQGQ